MNAPTRPGCWIVMSDPQRLRTLSQSLAGAGCPADRHLDSLDAALAALRTAAQPPGMVVMSLALHGGDGLQLIRGMAGLADPPLLWIYSDQQRAVVRAAVRLAEVCGLRVGGIWDETVPMERMVECLLREHPPAPPRLPARPARPALGEVALRQLLADGGLQAWMQPKMRVSTREIVGFEALMRARGPDGALITPDQLLPGLMAHDLLEEATLCMLRQTVGFLVECLESGLAVGASVNASMRSLSRPAFCRAMAEVVTEAGLDPSWITVEITETDAMDDQPQVIENAARIRMLGFKLAIDDFGVAYASLSQLADIPFSELKLDRNFVQELHRHTGKRAIVRGCANLGMLLGLQVVAEGVETMAEFEAVAHAGCTQVQGYLLSPAMPVDRARAWLDALPDQVWSPPA